MRNSIYRYLSLKYGLKESSIRAAASKAGLTSKATSLKFFFSKKEEEALIEVRIRQARQYRPFTVPVFCRVVRKFAETLGKPHFLRENGSDAS